MKLPMPIEEVWKILNIQKNENGMIDKFCIFWNEKTVKTVSFQMIQNFSIILFPFSLDVQFFPTNLLWTWKILFKDTLYSVPRNNNNTDINFGIREAVN